MRLASWAALTFGGLVRGEHGDTLVHTHEPTCEVGVRQIFPLGGPFNGNTAVTVSGRSFRDVGDVKCRFGIDEVQARLITTTTQRWVMNPRGRSFADVPVEENTTVLECSSPGCRSPTCLPSAAALEVVVPLEVSMNGITFTGSGLQFTYFDHDAVHVSLLTPRGGPRQGGTQLLVQGAGFRDLGSGVNGVLMQGIKCKFGANDMVNATKAWGDPSAARCLSPPDAHFVGTAGLEGRLNQSLRALPLELTFNGYDTPGTLTASRVPYTYYDEDAFNVSSLHPLGGPHLGGTTLTLYLSDEALLTDLGGGGRGLYCRFSYEEPEGELSHESVALRRVTVNASLTDCGGARACGYGQGALTCTVPPYTGPFCEGARTVAGWGSTAVCEDARNVTVEVTLNGQQFTSSGVHYEYYDADVWLVHALTPRGGPLGGNTSLLLSGMRLKGLGDVRCRLGVLNPEADALVTQGTTINAQVAAAHWLPDPHDPRSAATGVPPTQCGCEALHSPTSPGLFCDFAGPTPAEPPPPPPPYDAEARRRYKGDACEWDGSLPCYGHEATYRPYAFRFPGACQSCAGYAQREECAAGSLPARGAESCKRWCFPRQHLLNERTHEMTFVTCAAPAHWRQVPAAASGARVGAQLVEVEVTLNGQDYLTAVPHVSGFTYYPVDEAPHGVSVASLSPRGGPSLGGTRVVVNGTGLRPMGGLWCLFGTEQAVPATRQDDEHIACLAPPLALSLLNHTRNVTVEVTLNGQLKAKTSAAVPYEYYLPHSLRVSAVYPRGGPRAGGGAVTVWGEGFRDLDHGGGLHCKFGDAALVPATMRADHGDGQSLTCAAPACDESACGARACTDMARACESVPVRVTLNGDNPADEFGTARSQPCCDTNGHGLHFPEDVLYAYYETHDGAEVGSSTPGTPPGTDTTLTADPPGWTGDDMP